MTMNNEFETTIGLKSTTFLSYFRLNSRPCENSLADFCTSDNLTIYFSYRVKEVDFSGFQKCQSEKSTREFSHGHDLKYAITLTQYLHILIFS